MLETLTELIITEVRDEMRRLLTIIHEILKTQIPGLLEPHIIIKCLFDQIVHLTLELKEFDCKLDWVFQVLFIRYNFGTFLKNIRVHLVNYVYQSRGSSIEHLIHHAELLNLVLGKHVLAPTLLLGQGLSLLLNCLLQQDVQHFSFRLFLKEVVRVFFLLFNVY